jgi:hypothetical protein
MGMGKLFGHLLRLESSVSVWQSLVDHFTDSGIVWILSLSGGGLLGYLAHATQWLNAWGPIAWGAIAIFGVYLSAAAYGLSASVGKKRILNKLANKSLQTSTINPMLDRFDHQSININDFYNPYYVASRGKRLSNCRVYGPALLYLTKVSIIKCEYKQVQVVIIQQGATVYGAISFNDVVLTDCEICNVTFIMSRDTYQDICSKSSDFARYIPVISEHPMLIDPSPARPLA